MKKIMSKVISNKKILYVLIRLFIFLILCIIFLLIFFQNKTFSNIIEVNEIDTYELWDGSVSDFLLGNGTIENPYKINNGSDLMYFKNLIEGDDYLNYNEKYYKLGNNLNMNNIAFESIGTNERFFKGIFDGDGYSIANLNITAHSTADNTYLGLFSNIENATIKNINLKSVVINANSISENLYAGILVSNTIDNNIIKNIGIYDSTINISNGLIVGGLIGKQSDSTSINTIYLNTNIYAENSVVGKIAGEANGKIENVIIYTNDNLVPVGIIGEQSQISNIYSYTFDDINLISKYNDSYNLVLQNTSLIELSNMFTTSIDGEFTWYSDREYIRFDNYGNIDRYKITPTSLNINNLTISEHASGIENDTVYINDLLSDYNYFAGLNYTYSENNGILPNGENQNLYNSTNLVKTYIKYNGTDLTDTAKTGYVSLTELQSNYIYYKYYEVKDGYIDIELIDNPFTNRPTNSGFNGWVTSYDGATIYYDSNYYTRHAKIPVTYKDGVPNTLTIEFNASWITANVAELTDSNWNSAFRNLKSGGLKQITGTIPIYEDVYSLYLKYDTEIYSYFPNGAVDYSGNNISNQRCWGNGGCDYYLLNYDDYDKNQVYYQLNNSSMNVHDVKVIRYEQNNTSLPIGSYSFGYFKKVKIEQNSNYSGYYNIDGEYQSNGVCTETFGCIFYELIQFYDDEGEIQVVNNTDEYYYLSTRDTNIIVLKTDISNSWTGTKPFILTSIHNGMDYRNSSSLNVNNIAIHCYNDTTIENIKIIDSQTPVVKDTAVASGINNTRYLYGNWHNVKIGRGTINNGSNYLTFYNIIGGGNNSTGTSSNVTKYKLIIESGRYNSGSLTNGSVGTSYTSYVEAKGVYGSDYDRITNNNDNLLFQSCLSGSWGGLFYSSSTIGISFDSLFKSGKFGAGKFDNITGIYVGGREGGTHYTSRKAIIEGGWFFNVVGGPLTASNRANYNDMYLYIKGGEIATVTAGAGKTATYGNRIVQMTGGIIDNSLFGGSNGAGGRNGDGTVNGSSFIYVGGNSVIGSDEYMNNNTFVYGAESGSIFGIGNGKSGSSSIGSNDNSNVIIDGNALIKRNVYGGGNYGATGVSSTSSSSSTNIKILNGTINGSIYGGGNNNGSGSTSKVSTINISILGGNIKGSVYGGSRNIGTVYGDVNILAYGGIIDKLYGGGEGGYSSSTIGTYVSGNINIIVGNKSYNTIPTINSVYGGSAFGTVNGTSRTTKLSDSSTNVTINAGKMVNVFGGGEGNSTYSPYVEGNSVLTINGGTIENTFGGNDASGILNGTSTIYLNGGFSSNVYGGGNKVAANTSNVILNGGVVDSIYGGGNEAGIDTSNVSLISGSATTVYGGSNQSGTVNKSNITSNFVSSSNQSSLTFDLNLTKRNKEWYETVSHNSYEDIVLTINNNTGYDINKWEVSFTTVPSSLNYNYSTSEIFVDNTTYIINQTNRYYGTNSVLANSTYTIQFGLISDYLAEDFKIIASSIVGYDDNGNKYESTMQDVSVLNIYGGNNAGGITANSEISLNNALVSNVYGGGNLADISENSIIKLKNTKILNSIYGGGNSADILGNTYVEVDSSTVNNHIFAGGNSGDVLGTTELLVKNSTVNNSVYGGGNSASVYNGTKVTIGKDAKILESVFAGGNSGTIGTATNSATTELNVVGGTVEKNIYGGCNTSIVYGTTNVNVGSSAQDLTEKANINIKGNVFGGGEANAEGSENYDFSFISVTEGININIDGKNYSDSDLILNGSVFGSGNASSSKGISNIYINNLGVKNKPKKIISIQRSSNVIIDNSVIELLGTTDRTNEYSSILYSFNRIKKLKIKNNSILLLQQNANLLEEVESLVDIDGSEILATVDIDDEGNVTKNVDNRIYLITNKNLNITTNETATSYGQVSGMTFFGMYTAYANGSYSYGIYDMESGSEANAADVLIGGSYILGLHFINSDTTKNGFYTNYIDDEYTKVTAGYIDPTPPNANYYMWSIGADAINYSFSLTASKYSSLGTHELSLLDFSNGNTIFEVIGFDSEALADGVQIVDSNDVPKVSSNVEDANSIIGLSMKAETTEWTSLDTTKFLSENGGSFTGSDSYLTDNQAKAPSLTFYLYHAKNITLDGNLGTVNITLQALTPKNEIEYDVSLINITIDISAKNYDDQNAYDASITYSKKYEMPSATDVNITSNSSFTAYYSLYSNKEYFNNVYGNNNEYYRTLSSNYVLPVGTKITMIDLAYDKANPRYFYFNVDQNNYDKSINQLNNENEVTYDLRNFIAMDSISSNNKYDDASSNYRYFDYSIGSAVEEFVFIFDFENANITSTQLNNSIILELRNSENRTRISVLGIRQDLMVYNLYQKTNVVLNSIINMDNKYLYYDSIKQIGYDINVGYDQTENRQSIIDTTYESNSMGINVTFYDNSDNKISSSLLVGTSIKIDNNTYYPGSDGVFRIKLANKVSNLSKNLNLSIGSSLPSGNYNIKIDLFSSNDGLHINNNMDKTDYIPVTVVGDQNGIDVELDDESKIIDGVTGNNLSDSNLINFKIKTSSVLTNPNIRISLYLRNKDSYNSLDYEEIDLRSITSSTLRFPSIAGLVSKSSHEYLIASNLSNEIDYSLNLKKNLKSGTYLVKIMLYDENQIIDSCEKYIIVKKTIFNF